MDLATSLSNYNNERDVIEGNYSVDAENIRKLKLLIDDELLESNVILNGKNITLDELSFEHKRQQEVTLRLVVHNLSKHNFFYIENLEELLERYSTEKPDKNYYIHSLDYVSTSQTTPPEIKSYYNALQVIDVLKAISDHIEKKYPELELIFFQKEKLEILTRYSAMDLVNFDGINNLHSELTESDDKEKRQAIFKAVLIEVLKNQSKKERFSTILTSLDLFYEKYKNNYALYLSDFSFEKIKSEFEKEKIDYVKKLNQVITDIQNKIIAIPIAFILVGTQFEKAEQITVKNAIILIAAIIFSSLLHILLSNQRSTLLEIKTEIDELESKFKSDYKELFNKLKEGFIQLSNKHERQKGILIFVDVVVWTVAITSVLLFVQNTSSLKSILFDFYNQLQ